MDQINELALRQRLAAHGVELVNNPEGTWSLMKRLPLGGYFQTFEDAAGFANRQLDQTSTDESGTTHTYEEGELVAQWLGICDALHDMAMRKEIDPQNLDDILVTFVEDTRQLTDELAKAGVLPPKDASAALFL